MCVCEREREREREKQFLIKKKLKYSVLMIYTKKRSSLKVFILSFKSINRP